MLLRGGITTKEVDIITNDLHIRLQKERERYSIGKTARGKTVSRKVIAELMGIPSRCISQYERGDRKPSAETLVKIAEFYGTSTDYLLGLKEER